jgi:hypothetical protein
VGAVIVARVIVIRLGFLIHLIGEVHIVNRVYAIVQAGKKEKSMKVIQKQRLAENIHHPILKKTCNEYNVYISSTKSVILKIT